ncbi:MAG TPA: hypothetical protein DEO89_05555 [Lachnospiraceae bacterium]|nr:hypothetical protein [Lachnospiraceae bacterium]
MKHDENKVLFHGKTEDVTYGQLSSAMKKTGAEDCDVLFVHSEISFGALEKGVRRNEIKEILVDAIKELHVKTLIFPTFTFSFCNQEVYDKDNSKTAMGMLPEYVRKRQDAVRSDDPILSVAILGEQEGFDKMLGSSSCGEGGIFHILNQTDKRVKFMFFGTSPLMCFTYLHYVEERVGVPYRYLRKFSGQVIENGVKKDKEIELYVRYKGVTATLPTNFKQELLDKDIVKSMDVGDSEISVVDEKMSYDYLYKMLKDNPYICAIMPEDGVLKKEYSYGNVTTM